tara:strand:+ start:3034 stop:3471 length:438 start_codon:yes stop_codon:yes gene_type:complete
MKSIEEKQDGKATLVVTYNSVADFPAGTYDGKNGPVVVVSNENTRTWGREEAEQRLGSVLHNIYGRTNPEDVEQIFLYVGKFAKHGALNAAQDLAGEGNNLSLVACDCGYEDKMTIAERIDAPIIWAECGGRHTLGDIVKERIGS